MFHFLFALKPFYSKIYEKKLDQKILVSSLNNTFFWVADKTFNFNLDHNKALEKESDNSHFSNHS